MMLLKRVSQLVKLSRLRVIMIETSEDVAPYKNSLRTADVFPVVAFLLPKNNVCEPEQQNDFRVVKSFVLMLANQIKG